MRKWQSLGGLVVLSSAVACATATTAPDGVGSGGSGEIVNPGGGDGSVTAGTASMAAGTTSAGGQMAFGGGTGIPGAGSAGQASTGGASGAAGAHSGGSSGTSSGGSSAGGTAAGGSGTAGTTSGAGCTGLPMWDGGNYLFKPKMGDEIQWMGKKYKANQDIAYPNPECAPDAPAAYCSAWFTAEGSC